MAIFLFLFVKNISAAVFISVYNSYLDPKNPAAHKSYCQTPSSARVRLLLGTVLIHLKVLVFIIESVQPVSEIQVVLCRNCGDASFSPSDASGRTIRLLRHFPLFHRTSISTPRTHSSAARAIHIP